MNGSDRSEDMTARARRFAEALLDQFGDNAEAVAMDQAKRASGNAAASWARIASLVLTERHDAQT